MARLADRFALVFLPLTLAIAGGAWLLSGDPVRALAVLVVATPCPLILAVPVAIISGVSRCAARGVLVKGGGALETLARVRTVLFDKTGTVTGGRARLIDMKVQPRHDPSEVLRLAASLDQGSRHVIAEALVAAAQERGLTLELPAAAKEAAGSGIEGSVGGHQVVVGGWDFVTGKLASSPFQARIGNWIRTDGTVGVLVAHRRRRSPAPSSSPTRLGPRPEPSCAACARRASTASFLPRATAPTSRQAWRPSLASTR